MLFRSRSEWRRARDTMTLARAQFVALGRPDEAARCGGRVARWPDLETAP